MIMLELYAFDSVHAMVLIWKNERIGPHQIGGLIKNIFEAQASRLLFGCGLAVYFHTTMTVSGFIIIGAVYKHSKAPCARAYI